MARSTTRAKMIDIVIGTRGKVKGLAEFKGHVGGWTWFEAKQRVISSR